MGYYTGVQDVSYPFPTLSGKDISVPISIDYHASGIKIQDVASSVGIGFNLNAGGMVTRIVRGVPDGNKPRCSTQITDFLANADGDCDGEHDVFFFSMLGRTGKFFLDDSNVPQTMPYQDLKMLYNSALPDGGSSFVITDEVEYIYYFGLAADSREQTTYYQGDHLAPSNYLQKETFISTWYLSKVVSPKGKEVATFTYLNGGDATYELYGEQGIGCGTGSTVTRKDVKIKIAAAKYIGQIATTTGKCHSPMQIVQI